MMKSAIIEALFRAAYQKCVGYRGPASRFPLSNSRRRSKLFIVSVRRLDNDRIEIGLARTQHDSNHSHNYSSEKEVRAVLSHFESCEVYATFRREFETKHWAIREIIE